MNTYLIHQPRRSGKTTYFVEKAVENLRNEKNTIIVFLNNILRMELENRIEERLKEKNIEFSKRFDLKSKKAIFTTKELNSVIKMISLENFIKEEDSIMKYFSEKNVKGLIKDIFFDEALYKDINIETILETINKFFVVDNVEFRFTLSYDKEQQKLDKLKYIKSLIDKNLVKYSEIVFTNTDNKDLNQLKEYYEKYLDMEYFKIEVQGYLLKDKKYTKEIDYEDFLKYKSSKITKDTIESTKILSKLLEEMNEIN